MLQFHFLHGITGYTWGLVMPRHCPVIGIAAVCPLPLGSEMFPQSQEQSASLFAFDFRSSNENQIRKKASQLEIQKGKKTP